MPVSSLDVQVGTGSGETTEKAVTHTASSGIDDLRAPMTGTVVEPGETG